MATTSGIKSEDARVLLASTQQLRTHWSGVIVTHLTVAVTANVAFWSYFLPTCLDAVLSPNPGRISAPFLVTSAFSSALLGLWRLYARYTDRQIALLYADFLLYEGILGVPPTRGTSKYLCGAVPRVSLVLESTLPLDDKVAVVSEMATNGLMGNRAHRVLDLIVMVILVILAVIGLMMFGNSVLDRSVDIRFVCLIGNAVGLWSLICAMTRFQRDPSEKDVEDAMAPYPYMLPDNDTARTSSALREGPRT